MIRYLGQIVYVLDGGILVQLIPKSEIHDGTIRRAADSGDFTRADLVLGCYTHDGSGIAVLSRAEREIVASRQ